MMVIANDKDIYCGDFNLQDFIIGRPVQGENFKELEQILIGIKDYSNLSDRNTMLSLHSEWMLQKYPLISLSFLGISIPCNFQDGSIKLPKFSCYQYNSFSFYSTLEYVPNYNRRVFAGSKLLRLDVEYCLESEVPLGTSEYYLAAVNKTFENISIIDGRAIITSNDIKKISKHYPELMEQRNHRVSYRFSTKLTGIIPKQVNEEINASVLDDESLNHKVFFIAMNTADDYHDKLLPKQNILAVHVYKDRSAFVIANFDPVDISKFYVNRDNSTSGETNTSSEYNTDNQPSNNEQKTRNELISDNKKNIGNELIKNSVNNDKGIITW